MDPEDRPVAAGELRMLAAAAAGDASIVDAACRADWLRDGLRSAGAASGVVACRLADSGSAVRSFGPVSAASVFEAGSVTKPVTGLPLATSIRSLAHVRDPYRGTSLHRLVRDTRLVRRRRPGVAAYSNLGVALLGQALAAAAGMSYWELARVWVLTPLGMTSSGDRPASVLVSPAAAWDLGAFAPAGGLRGTVDDLLRLAWVGARPAESPLGPAAVAALTPRVRMGAGHVGWCWQLGPQDGSAYAWHNGATGASWAFIGATGSGAVATCVPATRRRAWDEAALAAVRGASAFG